MQHVADKRGFQALHTWKWIKSSQVVLCHPRFTKVLPGNAQLLRFLFDDWKLLTDQIWIHVCRRIRRKAFLHSQIEGQTIVNEVRFLIFFCQEKES